MKFVTIQESHYVQDLTILKGRLESEGIPCRLKNELTTQVFFHMATFLVELQVPEDEVEKALEIIRKTDEAQASEEE